MCSSAPDTSGMNRAAEQTAALGQSALDWYKQVYAEQAPAREAAAARANAVSDAQLAAMNTQTRIANEADQYNKDTFRPLERSIVSDAENFNTDAERERRAGLAGADVAQAFGAMRGQIARDLGRTGVNSADGKAVGMERELAASEALARASAMNKSRQDSLALGRALKMDAASLGRGLPSQQATATSLALNAGNSSVGNAGIPLSQAQQAAAQVGAGYQQAIGGAQASGNLYGQIANIQNASDASNAAIWGALGQGAGSFLGGSGFAKMIGSSDVNLKEDIQPADEQAALKAVESTPVSTWKYKAGTPPDDGGQPHMGPMAQDVKKTMGPKAAPKGKMIDLISMNGINMAAIKAVNAKVDKLAAAMGMPAAMGAAA